MEEKIRVLFAVQNLIRGGAEQISVDICNELHKRENVEVLIVSFSKENEYVEETKHLQVKYCNSNVQLSLLGRHTINTLCYEKIVDEYKPHIIHSNVYKCELITRENPRKNIAYFTHCHNNIPEYTNHGLKTFSSKRNVTQLYEKRRMLAKYKECNNHFLAISKNTYNFFVQNMPSILTENIHLFPNAINYNKYFDAQQKSLNEVLKLIMVGRMDDNKNQIFLLSVLKELKNRGVETQLTLLGAFLNNGDKIIEKAKDLGLENFMQMPGMANNVEEYLKLQNIYVHSAKSEAFGLVMVEAMAAGLPVVALNGGGNIDVIEEGKSGFIIPQGNVQLFADKIMEITNSESKYQTMSNYCKTFAKQFDIKAYTSKLLSLYNKPFQEQ